ncbi:arsenic resistance N-acetyltransferase ArsN2 [Haladaptatus sp. DYF46]|uniref:arsenic resistance N-acetyltransferase ArsN2 n=1 Tax=Haladaptatus sp. DYF46 TaxID=2886041 RepID=UPI001E5601F5|nr:arsenic resistance N-acetyltransferase ArsN2 [Haladaptatus sp. DYF46]
MSETTLVLRQADDAHRSYIRTLLKENGLPFEDVGPKLDRFYVAHVGPDPVGLGGVEVHGTDGLLRSVVVERGARDEGYGSVLCARLEERAAADGVETLHLLTTTAAEFFAERMYVEASRRTAPDAIRKTTEFADLCPDTATYMRKSL